MTRTFVILLSILCVILGACKKKTASTLSEGTALFFDDFNRADEALSASALWTVLTPGGTSFTVSNQQAYPQPSSNFVEAYAASSQTTGDSYGVQATFNITGGSYASFFEAYVIANMDTPDLNNSSQSYLCGIVSGTLGLAKDLSFQAAGSIAHDLTDGTSWVITMTRSGSTVTCSVSGPTSESISFEDSSPYSDGYFGLISNNFGTNFLYFDDFLIASFE